MYFVDFEKGKAYLCNAKRLYLDSKGVYFKKWFFKKVYLTSKDIISMQSENGYFYETLKQLKGELK